MQKFYFNHANHIKSSLLHDVHYYDYDPQNWEWNLLTILMILTHEQLIMSNLLLQTHFWSMNWGQSLFKKWNKNNWRIRQPDAYQRSCTQMDLPLHHIVFVSIIHSAAIGPLVGHGQSQFSLFLSSWIWCQKWQAQAFDLREIIRRVKGAMQNGKR